MEHFKPFERREVSALSVFHKAGWRLKRYTIRAPNRSLDDAAVAAASDAALARLPTAGGLGDAEGNHGVGFQIFHFSEQIPLVSPMFYWKWGSVLSNAHQIRSYSDTPYALVDGAGEVIGCLWEMEIVAQEIRAWRDTMLAPGGHPSDRLRDYLATSWAAPPDPVPPGPVPPASAPPRGRGSKP